MKTIGLIGGMSWESSIEYYRLINQEVNQNLGGHHNAKSIMYTVDFAEIETLQRSNRWDEADAAMVKAAKLLTEAGADFLVICTNTMHKSVPAIEKAVNIPILHIADATAKLIHEDGLQRIGLLGTRFTMEHDFYKGRLIDLYGLDVLIPEQVEREFVHHVIYEELVKGNIKPDSKLEFLKIINHLAERGAQGVVLGCTEIGLLVKESDTTMKLYDTTLIHAHSAVEMALK